MLHSGQLTWYSSISCVTPPTISWNGTLLSVPPLEERNSWTNFFKCGLNRFSKYYSKNVWLLVKNKTKKTTKNCCRLIIKWTLCDGGTWQSVAPWLCQTRCCLHAPHFCLDACAAPELKWLLPRLQWAAHIGESCGRMKAQCFHRFHLAATTGKSYG